MIMDSEAYLCDLCSEIYEHEEELSEHMKEDHKIENRVGNLFISYSIREGFKK